MDSKHYYVYILASHKNGTLYIGVTNDVIRRVYLHKKSPNAWGFSNQFLTNRY